MYVSTCYVNDTNLLFFIIRLECIQSKGNSLILQVMLLQSSNTRLIRMWSRKLPLPLPLPLSVERIKSEMPWFQIGKKKSESFGISLQKYDDTRSTPVAAAHTQQYIIHPDVPTDHARRGEMFMQGSVSKIIRCLSTNAGRISDGGSLLRLLFLPL